MEENSVKVLNDNNTFFDNIDLNKDISKMYELINDSALQEDFNNQVELSNLRNENYKRYSEIDITKYKELPNEFSDVVDGIISLYDSINVKDILDNNYEDSVNIKTIIDNIYLRITRLDNMVNSYLKETTRENDEKQKKFSIAYFKSLDINESLKNDLIDKYDNLVLYGSSFSKDMYRELSIQAKRKENIDEILRILKTQENSNSNTLSKERLQALNAVINMEIQGYRDKINYLDDLIPENSKYTEEYNSFKNFFSKLIAYDDTDYENARQTYDILSDEKRINESIYNFETLFINEKKEKDTEETFIFNKVGIINLKKSLDYITANYMDKLSDEDKSIIGYIFEKLDSNYDLEELYKALKLVVKDIWKNTITNIYSFNPNEDFYFICSNNQFIDEKYQTILLTKRELDRVDNYEDYQIGFICNYNDNIMYITENEDIMTVDGEDLSSLKTPLQLEQEFINFKVCNRIALDGYRTKVEAVYIIDDGNKEKYIKAIELANMYNLPLIQFKKQSN